MKNVIIIGGVATVLVVAAGVSNVIMIQHIAEVERKVDSFKPHQINVPISMQEEIVERLASDNKAGITSVSGKIDKIAIAQNEQCKLAEEAFEKAQELYRKGSYTEAKIYALNAIRHNQNNADYLKFYSEMVVQSSNAEQRELDQVLAILDGSLYSVSAEDVSKILTLREKVSQKKSQLDNQSDVVPTTNLRGELESIWSGEYALGNIINGDEINVDKLQNRIEKINALLGEELTDELRAKLAKDLQTSSNIYSAHLTLKSVTNALNKAASHAEKSSLTNGQILSARNQLSTAATLLAQVWVLELPQSIVRKAEKIQKRISDIDEKLNVIASQEAMAKYNILVERLRDIQTNVTTRKAADYAVERANKPANEEGTLTKYLKEIQKCTTELQTLTIFDKEGKRKAVFALKMAQVLALKVSSKRYQAYQFWAINKIEAVRQRRERVSAFKPYTDRQAIQDFKTYLMDIDRGLLTYDVGVCYDKVFYLIFTDQVPTKNQAALQYEKATFAKMGKLEDF